MSYAHIIREDPVRRGLLYLGTEGGLYVSFDDGDHWQPMQLGMPHAPVYGLVIQEHFNDLVVATYGRGFYILDDLSPLQKLTPEVTASAATLFAPRAAYRFRDIEANVSPNDDPTAGHEPAVRRRHQLLARARREARRAWRFSTRRERRCARCRAPRAPASIACTGI